MKLYPDRHPATHTTVDAILAALPSAQPILSEAQLRQLETQQASAWPPLMERAGQAAADWVLEQLARQSANEARHPVLILVGPGNNGGDALVVARLLHMAGQSVQLVMPADPDKLPSDARQAWKGWQKLNQTVLKTWPADNDTSYALAIDGLFGLGLSRPITGLYAELIEHFNRLPCPRLALDIPSGLQAASGRLTGPCIQATHTLSFIGLKAGLLTLNGPDYCGSIRLHDLDLTSSIANLPPQAYRLSIQHFRHRLQARLQNSHKGSHGSLMIIGGAAGMTGASLLAGRAALNFGAGRVYLGMLEALSVDALQPELMLRALPSLAAATTAQPARDFLSLAQVLVIGPGLGRSPLASEWLQAALDTEQALLLDADALNVLAEEPALWSQLQLRQAPVAPVILTPHPTEAARLLKTTTAAIQADRPAAALELARQTRSHVVLKGCGSVVCLADGRWFINTTGNAGLATAGTGDVLSGLIGSLLAQGWPADQALMAGVHLHGAAADLAVAMGLGPLGLCASELILPARHLLNRLIASQTHRRSDC